MTKQILLIEDDPFLIDIYTDKLKSEGFSVEVAVNGEEGLKKTKNKKYDLILLDIVLPHIDGWEFLREIRSDKKSKDSKVIILSNLSSKEEVNKGVDLGAVKYLIKANYSPSEVVEEIKKVLK